MISRDGLMDSKDVGDNGLGRRVGTEGTLRRPGCMGQPVATVIVRVHVEAFAGEKIGKACVAACVLGKTVIELYDSAWNASGGLRI